MEKQITLEGRSATPRASLRWQIGLSFTSFILMGANDGALGVLLPSIRAHYGVNDATISLIFLAGSLGYLTAAFNSGPLTGRLGYRWFLPLGACSTLLGALTYTLMPPFAVILLAGLLVGFGIGCIDAGLNAYIASLPGNTTKLNYLHAFYGVGAWLGPVVASGLLAAQLGWNDVYVIWTVASLALLVSFVLIFRSQRPAHREATASDRRSVLLAALRLRVVWLGALRAWRCW